MKKRNDEYGYLAGDDAIKAVADALLYVLSENQYGIRFGRDEFVMMFQEKAKK